MSIATVGQAALIMAVCGALLGCVAGLVGSRSAHPATWLVRAERGVHITVIGVAVASMSLVLALLAADYSLVYVASRISNDLSPGLRFTAWWSGQEGSLLLWLCILALYVLLVMGGMRRAQLSAAVRAGTIGISSCAMAFFAVLVACVARPFAVSEKLPVDGSGMSPALQNYWMAIHPPALYLGYVAVAIPVALVFGAALARDTGDMWIPLARRWMLIAWVGLSAGLVLGARWAYEEIGWGGYWAWDPVENAALMPWLTATAFMHSIMVQHRNKMLRSWNAGLAALTFCLSIFGTFITRSGVISSVHSFVSSPVGWWFIGFLAVSIVATLGFLVGSRSLRSTGGAISSVVSRESAFLFNGLLLMAIALTVLWGVLFPILSAAVGTRESMQASWFNFFLAAFGLPLLLLMAVGYHIPWRGTSARTLISELAVPSVVALLVGAAAVAVGGAQSASAAAGISLGVLVSCGVLFMIARSARQYRQSMSTSRWAAWKRTARSQRRRMGAHIAHLGIGLLAVAISAHAMGTDSVTRTVSTGESIRLAPWTLTYTSMSRQRTNSSMQVRARFEVKRGNRRVGVIHAGRNFYPAVGEVSNEVGVHRDIATLGDLFVAVDRLGERGEASVKVIRNPAINLLWCAGILAMVGGGVAAWPNRGRSSDRTREAERDQNQGRTVGSQERIPTI